MTRQGVSVLTYVHCRIGSLEMIERFPVLGQAVHCRIGSLEKLISNNE